MMDYHFNVAWETYKEMKERLELYAHQQLQRAENKLYFAQRFLEADEDFIRNFYENPTATLRYHDFEQMPEETHMMGMCTC